MTGERVEISVIIPVRDAERTIEETLNAVLAQECSAIWEVIVVDNRSHDGTRKIVEEYADHFSRLRLVVAGAADGAAYARNVGIAASDASSFAFCDGDDVVQPGWLAALYLTNKQEPVVTGPLDPYLLNPDWLAKSRGAYPRDRPLTWHGVFPVASFGNLVMTRAAFESLGGFREDYLTGEDHQLSLRLAIEGISLGFAPEAVVAYRMRSEPRALWLQGLSYGRNRPRLRREVVQAGFQAPSRFAGWRSWALMIRSLPSLRSLKGRAQWCWVAGVRLGHLQGSIRDRTVFL